MPTSQNARITVTATATATGNDGQTTTRSIDRSNILGNGTTAGNADKTYFHMHTIAATGSPENLDFVGGGLLDINGDAISWAELTSLVVYSPGPEDTVPNTINIAVGAGTNPLDFGCGANAKTVKPSEVNVLINTSVDNAYPLTGGSADALKLFIASGTNQRLFVHATGRSA